MLPNKNGIKRNKATSPPVTMEKAIIKAKFSKNATQWLIKRFSRYNIKTTPATPKKTSDFSKALSIIFIAIEINNNGKASNANIFILIIFRMDDIFDDILYAPFTHIWQIRIILNLHANLPV